MRRLTGLLVLAGAILLGDQYGEATYPNPNCVVVGNEVQCDLLVGTYEAGVAAGNYAKFTNRTGSYLQIDGVQGITNEWGYWSELCVALDRFVFPPDQNPAGVGEVGCTFKRPGENYPLLVWDGPSMATALSVPPNSFVYMSSHTPDAPGGYINHNYIVTASIQTVGVRSWRTPKVDPIQIPCAQQCCPTCSYSCTVWAPWQNTSGAPKYLGGATVFAVETPSGTTVDTACLYILTGEFGPVRWSYCSGVNTRGQVNVPVQTIYAGEWIGGQAVNTCSNGEAWGWTAYMYVWP